MTNNENNRLNAAFMPGCNSKDSVASPSGLKNTLNVINNRAQYFAKIAQTCLEEVRTLLAQVREYAAQNTNVTVEYVTNKIAELRNIIETALDNYLLKSNLNSELTAFGTTAQYVNSTQLSTAIAGVIPSQANNGDKLLSTDGSNLQWVPVHHDYSIFDIIPKDHILSYSETKGFAQLGSYVYKEALAGSYYGYPDFYSTCVAEKTAGAATTATIAGTTVTTYVNANGHVYYDIADKAAFDTFYNTYGECWYYGVDTTNERIFLPRSTRIKFGTTSNVGEYQEAGLPNITGAWGNGIRTANPLQSSDMQGALYSDDNNTSASASGSVASANQIKFDASRSSSVYGNSNTVEYSSTKLIPYMVVGNVSDWTGMTDVVSQGITILDQVSQGITSRATKDLDNLTNAGEIIGSGLAMPSTTYEDLTLGASGTNYTAPANGWFVLKKGSNGSNQEIRLTNLSNELVGYSISTTSNVGISATVQCKKGDEIEVYYSVGGNTDKFRFIYAVGSESEAS